MSKLWSTHYFSKLASIVAIRKIQFHGLGVIQSIIYQ